jgi:hypothetical protein
MSRVTIEEVDNYSSSDRTLRDSRRERQEWSQSHLIGTLREISGED